MAKRESQGDPIQAFYNRRPYPPPVSDLDAYRRHWQEKDRLRADFHLFWPTQAFRQDLDILVAGCGTSQAAKHAIRQPSARVVGIDVSDTSLAHTGELKRKYSLLNLELFQIPIERVADLGCTFDKIICTGVLHHLAEPEVGLRALHSVLKPDGAMQLMLYARYGRTGISMLQDYCRLLGLKANDEDLDDLLVVLRQLPEGHPLSYLLRRSPDFRHTDALADALLNPRDRTYTVSQVFRFLESCNLVFGRWQRQASYSPHCGLFSSSRHASRMLRLPLPVQYAMTELFRGTMTHHSFTAYCQDRHPALGRVRFDGEEWRYYVPVRHPSVISVQQRLPAGVAAVLINQEHIDTDLVNPCDAQEKRLFEAIDGNRTMAEIIDRVSRSAHDQDQLVERGRVFFQRLWWYDHIVVDASM